ncbi:MAG: MFS transporter [Saprospiraceae bacterium]|nr:MFS transporter [Candidatus Vicinibacter affinis]
MFKIKEFILNSYSGIHKNVWILATAMFINRCGSIVMLFLSVYLSQELQFTIQQTGMVMAMLGLGSLAGSLLGGFLVDKIGYYKVLVSTIITSGAVLFMVSFASNFYLVCVLIFLFTATGDAFRPANITAMSSFTDESNYTRSIGLNRLAMNLGFSVAPIIGGLLALINFKAIFWVDGLTCIAAGIFIIIFIGKARRVERKNKSDYSPEEIEKEAVLSPWKDYFYLLFLLVCLLYATSFFQFFTTLPLYYKNVYGLNPKTIGLLMAMNGLGVALIEMSVIYLLENKLRNFTYIKIGCLLLILAYIMMNVWHGMWVLVVSIILITLSEILAMPFMASFCMRRANPQSMGRYMGLYSMAWAVALIIAPIIGTQLIDRYSFEVMWYCLAGVTFLAMSLMFYIKDRDRLNVESN